MTFDLVFAENYHEAVQFLSLNSPIATFWKELIFQSYFHTKEKYLK